MNYATVYIRFPVVLELYDDENRVLYSNKKNSLVVMYLYLVVLQLLGD